MSISGVGAAGSSYLSQILAKMLTQLDGPQNTTSTTTSPPTASVASTTTPPVTTASTMLTGNGQQTLSAQILALLVQLQSLTSSDGAQTSSNPATPASVTNATASSNPVQQLFGAMDGNGDGVVDQSEMEKYIESAGGTQAQADTLYNTLNQNGSSGISEPQMASAVGKGHHGHHHHHASGASNSADAGAGTDGLSDLFAAMDTNSDGSVSQSELGSFLTSLQQQSPFGSSASTGTGLIASQSYNSTSVLLSAIDPTQIMMA